MRDAAKVVWPERRDRVDLDLRRFIVGRDPGLPQGGAEPQGS